MAGGGSALITACLDNRPVTSVFTSLTKASDSRNDEKPSYLRLGSDLAKLTVPLSLA